MPKLYAYGEPDLEAKTFITDSLRDNISRFLYSWIPDCDLNCLKDMSDYEMTTDQKEIWRRGKRLLTFQKGDWIFHKNVPEKGLVTAARISSSYFYDATPRPLNNSGRQDGRHCFYADKVFVFERNKVDPQLCTDLKLMGALYRIYREREFYESMWALGMPFDEIDRSNAENLGVILTDNENISSTDSDDTVAQSEIPPSQTDELPPLPPVRSQQITDILSLSWYTYGARKEYLREIMAKLEKLSPQALQEISTSLFVNCETVVFKGKNFLICELFPQRTIMHDVYKLAFDITPKLIIKINSNGVNLNDFTALAEMNRHWGGYNRMILINLAGENTDELLKRANEYRIILLDGIIFAELLIRYGMEPVI